MNKTDRIYPVDVFVYNHIKFFTEKCGGYCFQSNEKIANEIGRHKTNISRSISKLIRMGYVKSEKENGRKLSTALDLNIKNVDNLAMPCDNLAKVDSDKLATFDDKIAMLVDILAMPCDNLAMDKVIKSLRGCDNLAKQNIEFKLKYLNNIYLNNNIIIQEKEIKKEKENLDDSFAEFWLAYMPVKCDGRFVDKGSKKTAYERYIKAVRAGAKPEDILTGLKKYLAYCLKNNQLTCQACVFLNKMRWQDDFDTKTITSSRNVKLGCNDEGIPY